MAEHPIKIAADKLPQSIFNTAKLYVEGRNVLMVCLTRSSKRTAKEVIEWLKKNKIHVKDIDKYLDYDNHRVK